MSFKIRLIATAWALILSSSSLLYAVTVRIGEVGPLTGKLAKHGLEIHDGILFAVEEANGRGGLKGNAIELISRDDQSLPEVAIHQTEDLVFREKVIGLVGGYVDSLVGPISEVAAKNHIPYVASASLQRSLTRGRDNPFFFRVSKLDGIVEPLCSFLLEIIKPRRVAILFAATPGSTEFGHAMMECLKDAGIDVCINEKFRPGTPDFSAFVMNVRKFAPEVLISGGFFPDHLILVRQLHEQKINLKAYIAPWGVAYESFIDEMGKASEGLFGLCAWSDTITMPGTEAESARFVEEFKNKFGRLPTSTTMHGYTSARALLAAIEKVLEKGTELSGREIARELRALNLTLPMEHLSFDQKGDPENYQQTVVQIQNGRMIVVYPPTRATGKILLP